MKLAIIKQKTVKPLGNLVRRMAYLEDIFMMPFEQGNPSGIYLVPKTSDVEATEVDIGRAISVMRDSIIAFMECRDRMSASAFAVILEDMEDDLRVLKTFGPEETCGKEEERADA